MEDVTGKQSGIVADNDIAQPYSNRSSETRRRRRRQRKIDRSKNYNNDYKQEEKPENIKHQDQNKKNRIEIVQKSTKCQTPNKYTGWKQFVPQGVVDPITLEPLKSLKYPPFALAITEPFEPINEWPTEEMIIRTKKLNDSTDDDNDKNNESTTTQCNRHTVEDLEERQRRILSEQWGSTIQYPKSDNQMEINRNETKSSYYNLFDGQALAYYMISQQQFIDPYNRRDLTRDEIINLDRYLCRHRLQKHHQHEVVVNGDIKPKAIYLNITEAYDTYGLSLSTAGASASSAAGRTELLRQQAQMLLSALYSSTSITRSFTSAVTRTRRHQTTARTGTSTNEPNSLRQQYQAYSIRDSISPHRTRSSAVIYNQQETASDDNTDESRRGLYGDENFLVVDEDLILESRTSDVQLTTTPNTTTVTTPIPIASNVSNVPITLWSASHIIGRKYNQGQGSKDDETEFPLLTKLNSPQGKSQSKFVNGNIQLWSKQKMTRQKNPWNSAQ